MPSLSDLVAQHADLDAADVEWLHRLVGDWQLLSDLSFADLVLWVGARDGSGYVAVAHCRPTTGPTVHYDDMVGQLLPSGRRHQLDQAVAERRICRERDPEWHEDVPVREEAIPVVREGRAIAVLSRHTNLAAARTPSRLELTYIACADDLASMVASGDFPLAGAPTGQRRGAPRVGDGLARLDAAGRVLYASPNALSGFHRLGVVGDLVGQRLVELTADLVGPGTRVDEAIPLVLTGRAPWRTEFEARGTALSLRAVPLVADGRRTGALLLLRDVTELRRRERELLSKDATIREIHHRVKNNLQTVAALLRLQARRLGPGAARESLGEAIRRVTTIAVVHETLAQRFDEAVDFDQVAERCIAMAAELASPSSGVRTVRHGSFGLLGAEQATPLALVLTELVTNAVEHGLAGRPGQVTVEATRAVKPDGDHLVVEVADDGLGLPEGFVPGGDGSGGLGTQIVLALAGELGGQITWQARPVAGTSVVLSFPLLPTDD